MSDAKKIGTELVELCKQGKNEAAIERLYHPNIVSMEAAAPPGMSREAKGIQAVLGKSKWWNDVHEVHSAEIRGPFPHDDKFAVYLKYDITNRQTKQRFNMEEVALY